MAENRLYRSETDKILGGVCGGIAEVYDLDPSLVRIAVLLLVVGQIGILGYLIAWLIIPSESEVRDREDVEVDDSQHEESEEEE